MKELKEKERKTKEAEAEGEKEEREGDTNPDKEAIKRACLNMEEGTKEGMKTYIYFRTWRKMQKI